MKLSVSQGLGAAGALCFVLIPLLPEQKRPLVLIGSTLWDTVFFRVLAVNYRNKAPVPTRGGLLRYEERPRAYNFVHGLMVFLGVFFLIVIVSLTVFSR